MNYQSYMCKDFKCHSQSEFSWSLQCYVWNSCSMVHLKWELKDRSWSKMAAGFIPNEPEKVKEIVLRRENRPTEWFTWTTENTWEAHQSELIFPVKFKENKGHFYFDFCPIWLSCIIVFHFFHSTHTHTQIEKLFSAGNSDELPADPVTLL